MSNVETTGSEALPQRIVDTSARMPAHALQQRLAKIVVVPVAPRTPHTPVSFSALQRAEIAEIILQETVTTRPQGFSALQRAEIAEIDSITGAMRS